ncbi:MAG TPA: ABC transporter ATP-binding protein [Acidimicrobiales bacterium]|nr:ABC transporter ATP-binding protein [Acidimicrobiales bacterium]
MSTNYLPANPVPLAQGASPVVTADTSPFATYLGQTGYLGQTRDMVAASSLRNVRKRYTRHGPWILDGADMELAPATVTLVEGGNGSGKSTLLRLAAGLTEPTQGRVQKPRRVAFVPEHQPAAIRLTGEEYLGHLGRIRGAGVQAIKLRTAELCLSLGLRPGPEVPMDQLSKGNRQKLFFAQAFLCPSDLLVLDEPLSGLDSDAVPVAQALIAQARHDGAMILLTSHDLVTGFPTDRRVRVGNSQLVEVVTDDEETFSKATTRRVRLTPGSNVDPPSVASLPGVVAVGRATDGAQVVDVAVSCCDQLLASSIAMGWSIVSVGPTPEQQGPAQS